MAKIHLDRLKDRHGYSGEKYRALVQRILAENTRMVNNRMGEFTAAEWSNFNRRIPRKQTPLKLPTLDEVLPAKSVQLLKAAQQGDLITDTLRDALTKRLRDRVADFTGKPTSKVSRDLVKQFESDIRDVYTGYTRKDPKIGMPTNIHTIAVTEVRVPISRIKRDYAAKIADKNPRTVVMKRWVHNRSLSKDPRPGHLRLNGTTVGINEKFKVKQFRMRKGRWMATGVELQMDHPHDPSAPAEEVIGCNCDCVYITKKVK